MVNCRVPFRTSPDLVRTLVGSTLMSCLSSSWRMYFATVLALMPVCWQMRRNLPLPLFLLVVSFVSLLSVSILLVQKTLPEHGVYRLCGCSRRESFFILLLGIGLMGLVGGALVMGYVALCPWLAAQEWIVQESRILDNRLLPWLASFTLIYSGMPVLLCWLQMRKSTPVEHYRRELK